MLRSEIVEPVSFYCSENGIRNVIERLGESSTLQIMNTDTNSDFETENDQLEQTELKLRYLRNELEEKHPCTSSTSVDLASNFLDAVLEIDKHYEKITYLKESARKNEKEESIYERKMKMIDFGRKFAGEDANIDGETRIKMNFIMAISDSDKKIVIKKLLRQRMRRNVYIKSTDVVLKSDGSKYAIFVIYVISQEHAEIAKQLIKSLNGGTFDFINTDEALHRRIEEKYRVSRKLGKDISRQIMKATSSVQLRFENWEYLVNKERAIVDSLRKLRKIKSGGCFVGNGWVLRKDLPKLNNIRSFDNERGRFMFEITKSDSTPPTHFETSAFSKSFQNLTNVFGIPKYREINPAIFMTFTFPFLFGAMFGDILHGLILLSISIGLLVFHTKMNGTCGVFQIILDGRHIMLACSFAAIWFGFLYGDFGSLPVSLFRSQYETGRTYPIGIDPIWHHADNKMIFINSLKMKLSLIIGFCHMGLGSLISVANAIHFQDKLTLFGVVIPQVIAFFLFLGYVVFLCVYKWLVTIDHPSLVNTLITMYTDPFNMKNQMYPGQMYVQLLIYSLILICIPWMMLSKPLYLMFKKRVPQNGILDLWITSGIHVVEFCLGLISNTSSYLRLWAVSLAHVQLTTVLHEFTLGNSNIFVKLLTFPIYFFGTLMLLIGLEGLSSCLHALRLNWIEFFSKFYSGGGVMFEPFNFVVKHE